MTSRSIPLFHSFSAGSAWLRMALLAWALLLSACEGREQHPVLDFNETASPRQLEDIYQGRALNPGYSVAFDPRVSLREDARQYQPLIEYLERKTGLPFHLQLQAASDRLEQAWIDGRIDFAIIGAGSYLKLRQQAGILPLVRGLNRDGEPGYRSYLVTRPDSPLQGISSLAGRRLALGHENSTQGALIPRIMLAREGLSLRDLGAYFLTGSHRNCAEAVINGSADACGLQDLLARQLIEAGELRPLAISEIFPSSGIFVSPRVPETVRLAVRNALLAFDPQTLRDRLYHWDRTEMAGGFTTAEPADYELLDRWLQRFREEDRNDGLLDHRNPRLPRQPGEGEDAS